MVGLWIWLECRTNRSDMWTDGDVCERKNGSLNTGRMKSLLTSMKKTLHVRTQPWLCLSEIIRYEVGSWCRGLGFSRGFWARESLAYRGYLKRCHWVGSQKNECQEKRGPRIESWAITTVRSLGVEEKPEMEKSKSAGQCGIQEARWRKCLQKGRINCANALVR